MIWLNIYQNNIRNEQRVSYVPHQTREDADHAAYIFAKVMGGDEHRLYVIRVRPKARAS